MNMLYLEIYKYHEHVDLVGYFKILKVYKPIIGKQKLIIIIINSWLYFYNSFYKIYLLV